MPGSQDPGHWTALVNYQSDRRASAQGGEGGGQQRFGLREGLSGRYGGEGTIESGGGRERAEGGRSVCMSHDM